MGLHTILKKMKEKEKELRLLMLGLDNAGKTTVVKKFNGEDIDLISPTLGFNIKTLEYRGFKLNVWDVGGQTSLRSYWRNYFEQTDGLIWVVDSADRARLRDCKAELQTLLQQEVRAAPHHAAARAPPRSPSRQPTHRPMRSASPAPLSSSSPTSRTSRARSPPMRSERCGTKYATGDALRAREAHSARACAPRAGARTRPDHHAPLAHWRLQRVHRRRPRERRRLDRPRHRLAHLHVRLSAGPDCAALLESARRPTASLYGG